MDIYTSGKSSIAITGITFKNIYSNWICSLLVLLQDPDFQVTTQNQNDLPYKKK